MGLRYDKGVYLFATKSRLVGGGFRCTTLLPSGHSSTKVGGSSQSVSGTQIRPAIPEHRKNDFEGSNTVQNPRIDRGTDRNVIKSFLAPSMQGK